MALLYFLPIRFESNSLVSWRMDGDGTRSFLHNTTFLIFVLVRLIAIPSCGWHMGLLVPVFSIRTQVLLDIPHSN